MVVTCVAHMCNEYSQARSVNVLGSSHNQVAKGEIRDARRHPGRAELGIRGSAEPHGGAPLVHSSGEGALR